MRLALVQTAIGAIVVLVTSTLNRVMIVELALPAVVPASLVATHYLIQLLRLHHGYRVDAIGRAGTRIVGGLAVLAVSGIAAAVATVWMRSNFRGGLLLSLFAYLAVGIGVGAAGTANLTLLSKRVAPRQRPLVAALVWIMMIAGFSVSAGLAGHFLQPFSARRLVQVFAVACTLAFLIAWLAVRRLDETPVAGSIQPANRVRARGGFGVALQGVWADPVARRFTAFLFISMLAFSAQELLLEPFAGLVFGLPPGASARLSGLQNAGVLVGMVALVVAAVLRRGPAHPRFAVRWMIGGTIGSALAIAVLALIAGHPLLQLLFGTAFALGLANGVFAVAALGVMMELSSAGGHGGEGVRMGLWGAAQALAFAAGGLNAGIAADLSRRWLGSPAAAYACVFCFDAALFLVASGCAFRLGGSAAARQAPALAAKPALEL
jgi:BCD family chlorophyll transporter-like MFS transporter